MGEKNNLGAANRKLLSYGCTDTGGTTLYIVSYTHEEKWASNTVIMITLECIKRSEVLLAPPKYIFSSHIESSKSKIFRRGITNGNKDTPSNITLATICIGIFSAGCCGLLACGSKTKVTVPYFLV